VSDVRPPDGRLQVSPARLPGPPGGRARAYLVLAVVVGVIVVGVGLASFGSSNAPAPEEGQEPTGSLAPAASAGLLTPAAPTGESSAVPTSTPPGASRNLSFTVLAPAELEAGVFDGSLDASLVFLRARLLPQEQRCGQSFAVGCVVVAVPGLDIPIDLSPALVYWEAPPPGVTLVMRPDAGRLVYLGVLAPDAVSTMTDLLHRRPTRPFPMTLAKVGGWLLHDPHGLCAADSAGTPPRGATPCPVASPFLADEAPLSNGTLASDRGASVAIEADAVGLGDETAPQVGTFLVRHAFHSTCDVSVARCPTVSLSWDVVARLVGVSRYLVTVP
jgi:hypothetical protein